jgi:hypothetical protein
LEEAYVREVKMHSMTEHLVIKPCMKKISVHVQKENDATEQWEGPKYQRGSDATPSSP